MNSSFTNSTDSIWEKEWEKWKISDEIQNEFKEIFMQVDQDHDGFISGEQAKLFFSSSGLSKEVLAKIWSLSDRNRDLKLDLKEYIIAMFLIRMKQAGAVIPNSLPKNLVSSVYPDQTGSPSKTPQSSTEKLPPFLSNSISTQDFRLKLFHLTNQSLLLQILQYLIITSLFQSYWKTKIYLL